MEQDPITKEIIGAAIEVHKALGPGLLESAYQTCLAHDFNLRGIQPVQYKGLQVDCSYRLDFVVESQVVLELKSVEALLPIHEAQLLTYLKLTGCKIGLLINFNVPVLIKGVKRFAL